jgi:hypothetical protein
MVQTRADGRRFRGECLRKFAPLVARAAAIEPGHAAPLWQLLPGFGAALILWATGAGLPASSRAFTVPGFGSAQASR